ncbi:MAG TPA: YbbR-like domain-containing protein [Candidatus Eisenbacteria bacterium]|jgi:YbbR domain-containing protein
MSLLRGLLFDNLGLKLVALLLAVLVYLNVYTDRPATMTVSFPISLVDLADSLSLVGPVPAAVQAEIRGTGKQLIRLRLTEPQLVVSLAGVQPGRFERAIGAADLPLQEGLEVERLVGPRMLSLDIDRRLTRRLPVAVRLEWAPALGSISALGIALEPESVTVSGPARVVARVDSVRLAAVHVDGRRDTVRAQVGPEALPERCTIEPPFVGVTVILNRAGS